MQLKVKSRERVEAAIRFQEADRVPFNFWMDRRRMAELEQKYGSEFRVTHYDADVIECYYCFPPFPVAEHTQKGGTSWMVKELFDDWRELADIPMPDPADPRIYEKLDWYLDEFSDRAIIVNSPGVLSITEMMRKQENLYTDLLMQPDDVKAAFERFSDVMAAVAERVCRRATLRPCTCKTTSHTTTACSCRRKCSASLSSLTGRRSSMWRHAHEKPVFFHTDGKCDAIWDVFREELGVWMLNPLQPELQDLGDYKRRFDGRMGVYGGLSTGRIHTMSPSEIRAHVLGLFEQTGRGGGLIVSSHDIDYAITEVQLEALAGAIRECRY